MLIFHIILYIVCIILLRCILWICEYQLNTSSDNIQLNSSSDWLLLLLLLFYSLLHIIVLLTSFKQDNAIYTLSSRDCTRSSRVFTELPNHGFRLDSFGFCKLITSWWSNSCSWSAWLGFSVSYFNFLITSCKISFNPYFFV